MVHGKVIDDDCIVTDRMIALEGEPDPDIFTTTDAAEGDLVIKVNRVQGEVVFEAEIRVQVGEHINCVAREVLTEIFAVSTVFISVKIIGRSVEINKVAPGILIAGHGMKIYA